MRVESTRTKYTRQQKVLYLIMISGLLLLITANAFAWFYLQQIKQFFISDLKFRLENIAVSASALIDASDIEMIIPESPGDAQLIYYQQLLYQIKDDNNLQDIFIISPANEILVSTNSEISATGSIFLSDDDLITQALRGISVSGELQSLGAHRFLRAAVPITTPENSVTGALLVEAPAEFFNTLDLYDNSLTIFSLINGLVIIGVGLLFFRSLHKVVYLQDQIRDQEHLVKLGEMAAAVAHEIRNPLSIIKGTNTLIDKKYAKDDDELFTYIPTELDRLNQLIEDFLTFARSREPEFAEVNIDDLLAKVKIGFIDYPDFKITVQINPGIHSVTTDANMLEQILLNGIQNSIQATDGSGEVEITVLHHGKFIHFDIKDNGPGIPKELQYRIFEPFFSTKEKGSGLGLAISRRLCDRLGGRIQISSTAGSGTTLSILIPK